MQWTRRAQSRSPKHGRPQSCGNLVSLRPLPGTAWERATGTYQAGREVGRAMHWIAAAALNTADPKAVAPNLAQACPKPG